MHVDINVQVELASPLHVGSGSMADSLADKPLLKDAYGLPVISGSSLKGRVRHAAEKIVTALAPNVRVCEAPYPDRMCRGPDLDKLCPVCRVFGAPGFPAPVRFGRLTLDLAPAAPALKVRGNQAWAQTLNDATEVRTGVGLSRSLRTAQEDILYTVETYPDSPALMFQGKVQGALEERRDVALLVAALRTVNTLGGNRSRGLGWCQVVAEVRLDDVKVDDIRPLLEDLTYD
jgi:CRISPR/Cas system CSM-associated protein Csm3 (group 7 of RAMP superfamily)